MFNIKFEKSVVVCNGMFKVIYTVYENGVEIGGGSCPKGQWEKVKLAWVS